MNNFIFCDYLSSYYRFFGLFCRKIRYEILFKMAYERIPYAYRYICGFRSLNSKDLQKNVPSKYNFDPMTEVIPHRSEDF